MFGQTSPSGQAKFVTPATLSACNHDTIYFEITNLQGGKNVSYTGSVQVEIDIPGGTLIEYVAGSLYSVPTGVSQTAYSNKKLTAQLPLPSIGTTTRVYFVVKPDCNVANLTSLPRFYGKISYPQGFPTSMETFTSSPMNVGKTIISLSPYDPYTINGAWGENPPVRRFNAINTGYGNIDKLIIEHTVEGPLSIARNGDILSWIVGLGTVNGNIPPSSTTTSGNFTTNTYEFSGASLGPDHKFTPGENLIPHIYYLIPEQCATYREHIKVYYTCSGSVVQCEDPQEFDGLYIISAGTPKLTGTLISAEDPDGCPNKSVSYKVTNTGTGNANPVGNAYDVDLNINFGGGLLNITNLRVNGIPVPSVNVSPSGSNASNFKISMKDLVPAATPIGGTTATDGLGFDDLDNDGFADDMRVGAEVTITFDFTMPCDLACGANLYYRLSSNNTFTDYCRTLTGTTNTLLKEFGFQQVQPLEQEKTDINSLGTAIVPDYGVWSTGADTKTKLAKFRFQYKEHNVDLSAAAVELRINYSSKMEVNPATIRVNGAALTNPPVLQGSQSVTPVYGPTDIQPNPNATIDNDSAYVILLTPSEISLFFDNQTDTLAYEQTYYGCNERQAQGNSDSWSLWLRSKPDLCADTSTPCTFDLACKKPFSYSSGTACFPKPCYITNLSIYRDKPIGFTDPSQTTSIPGIDSTRSYAGDTVTINSGVFINGFVNMEPLGTYTNQGQPFLDFRNYFSINYSVPKGYLSNTNPFLFLPSYSEVVVKQRTPDPLNANNLGTLGPILFRAPILLEDFAGDGGNRIATVQNNYGLINYTYPTPYGSTLYGPGYYCLTNPNVWFIRDICPAEDGYYYTSLYNNISASRYRSQDQTKINDLYYLNFGKTLARAGWTENPGDTSYYYEIITRWKMRDDFPRDNASDWGVAGSGVDHLGNYSTVDYYNPQSTYNASCNQTAGRHLTVTKEHKINNPKAVYNADCGLIAHHEVFFKSFEGNYFGNSPNEVRVPLKIDSIAVNVPSVYSISNTQLSYNQGCADLTYNMITPSAVTGQVTFINQSGGDFPRADDCSGNKVAYDLSYQLTKTGVAAPTTYRMPIAIYGRDEFNNQVILYDTASISESDPELVLTPLTPILRNVDGGDCSTAYFDFKIQNNTLFDAPNVYLAAEGSIGTIMVDIKDHPDSTYIDAIEVGDVSPYGIGSQFAKIGTVSAGDIRIIRVYANTSICSDQFKVYTDFGCAYPTPLEPNLSSTTIDESTANYVAAKPVILSRMIVSTLNVTDLCGTREIELEIRNADLSNIYNMLVSTNLPASMKYVVGSAQLKHPIAGTYTNIMTVLTPTGDSLALDLRNNAPFNTVCGLTGSDTLTKNDLRIKFQIEFQGCPSSNLDELLFDIIGENYCGTKTTTQLVLPVNYVGNAGTQNNYSLHNAPKTFKICATANDIQRISDTLIITNLGGYGSASGASSGVDSVTFTIPFNNAQFTVDNFSIAAPFTNPYYGTDSQGNLTMTLAIPAGLAVNSSLNLVLDYDITPKVNKVCEIVSVPPLCFFAQFSSPVILGCSTNGLNCTSVGKSLRGSGLSLRNFECCYGSIGDYVWFDTNNDGQQGNPTTEMPVNGVKVYLWNTLTNMIIDSTTTNAMGMYLFDSLFDGSYQVQFIPPAGSILAMQNIGNDATDSDANPMGFSQTVNIQALDPTTQKPRLATDLLLNNPTLDAGLTPVDRPRKNPPPGEESACHVITPDLRLGLLNEPDSGIQIIEDDGISNLPALVTVGTILNLEMEVYNNTGGSAYLVGWMDWDGDGVLEPATEQIILQTVSAQGTSFVPVSIMIPTNALQNMDVEMAFRISTLNGLLPYGEPCAPDGEYENYTLRFVCPPPVCLPVGMVRN